MASQFSPTATDDEDHQGTDGDDCTSPTTSPTGPPTGPLLSPDTTLPSSLPNSSISKMTYNVTANSYSNGYSNTYSSGASTHHYLPPSNLSHTPSTINSPYTQHYTPLPPVASLPATMSNVVMYSPNHAYTHGQPEYSHPLAGPAWSHIK